MVQITLTPQFHLSRLLPTDSDAYVEHLKEKQIQDQTLSIPYPYTKADFNWWLNHNIELNKKNSGHLVNWVIRRSSDQFLIGGIGFHDHIIGSSHQAALGYWLAKDFWGQGIVTLAVAKVIEVGFKDLGLHRITASVFDFNIGSARVLEKNGFKKEDHLRHHYFKNGKYYDGFLFGKLSTD